MDRERCDRADIVIKRAVNCGWITLHNEQQLHATIRIALDTEVEAGGPYLNDRKQTRGESYSEHVASLEANVIRLQERVAELYRAQKSQVLNAKSYAAKT